MNKKTNKCRFKSRYDGGFLSSSQYIMEIFCEIIAKQQKKELPENFWKIEPWAKIFKQQIPAAVALLNKYPVEVVSATIKDNRICNKINSLRANWLIDPILQEKYREWQIKNKKVEEERTKTSTVKKPRGGLNNSKSLLEQLKEL